MGNPNQRPNIPVFRQKAEASKESACNAPVDPMVQLASKSADPAKTAAALKAILGMIQNGSSLPFPRQDGKRGEIVFDTSSQSYVCNCKPLSIELEAEGENDKSERFAQAVTPEDIALLRSGNLIDAAAYEKFWTSSKLTIEVALPSRALSHFQKARALKLFLQRLNGEMGRLAQKAVKQVDVVVSFPPMDAKDPNDPNSVVDKNHSEQFLKGVANFVEGFAHPLKAAKELEAIQKKLEAAAAGEGEAAEESLSGLQKQLEAAQAGTKANSVRVLVRFGGKNANFRLMCVALFPFYTMDNTKWVAWEETQGKEAKPKPVSAQRLQELDDAFEARKAGRQGGDKPAAPGAHRKPRGRGPRPGPKTAGAKIGRMGTRSAPKAAPTGPKTAGPRLNMQ